MSLPLGCAAARGSGVDHDVGFVSKPTVISQARELGTKRALMVARFIAALVLFANAQFVAAQNAVLTLERAVQLGVERAPQLQAQAAALEAARAEAVAAGRLPDPELMVGASNVPAEGPDAWSLERDFMTMREVGVMQAFPNRRKRASQRERASAAIHLAQVRELQSELEIAQQTAQAWVAVYGAQWVLQKLEQLRPEIELQAQTARAALRSGRGSSVDALAAESAISELEDEIVQAQRDLAAARAQLARWIGEHAQPPLSDAPELQELPAPRESLLASIQRQAPLLTFDAELAVARSEIDLARAEKRPDWSAQLSYANRAEPFDDMISLEFRVGLPVFSRYRQDPVIAARHAQAREIEAQREVGLRMQTAQVQTELAAWDAARRRIELYHSERLPLARQRSQAALAGFQAGRIPLTSALDAYIAEIELQRSYAELIEDLGAAWAFLRYLTPEDLRRD